MNEFLANISNTRPQASKDINYRPSPEITKLPNDSNSNNLDDEKMDILSISRQEVEALISKINISKAHIPLEIGFALGTNANEIYTKKMKYTWPMPAFCVGTQRQLYSTDWRRGLASGVTQILGLASGIGVGGNAKIYQHFGIFCVG